MQVISSQPATNKTRILFLSFSLISRSVVVSSIYIVLSKSSLKLSSVLSCSGALRVQKLRSTLVRAQGYLFNPGVGILPGNLAYYFPLSGPVYFTFSKTSPNKAPHCLQSHGCHLIPPALLLCCLVLLLLLSSPFSTFGPVSCLLSRKKSSLYTFI